MHFRRPSPRLCRATIGGLGLVAASLGVSLLGARAQQAEPRHPAALDRMIVEQARKNGVPEKLVRRIIMRESKYDPSARNHLYWGLMQISYPTAKSMGFKGTAEELLNPLVNLTYAVPYLANAFLAAGKREDEAVRLYAAGYYYTARRRGLLGLLRTAESDPVAGEAAPPQMVLASVDPTATPAPSPVAVDAGVSDAHGPKVDVAMVAGKDGAFDIPKKWARDGGVTRIARGEQGLESVAAYAGPQPEAEHPRRSARHANKSTEFASIDATPATAQAYAAPAQDPRFAQAPSQAAIMQATAQPALAPQDPAAQEAQAQSVQSQAAQSQPAQGAEAAPAGDDGAKKTHRRAARRHRGTDHGDTEVAKSKPAQDDAKPKTAKGADTVNHAKVADARHGRPKKARLDSVVAENPNDQAATPPNLRQ